LREIRVADRSLLRLDPAGEYVQIGFRVASLVPEPLPLDWVPVGNPNNTADAPSSNCLNSPTNCGSVDHAYFISKYEVTNAQYAEFLNAKAASDPLGLYNESMGTNATSGGITQSGVSGSFTYTAKAGFANKPVTYVSFYDSLRFANWLNNGQGIGDTETGAHTRCSAGPPRRAMGRPSRATRARSRFSRARMSGTRPRTSMARATSPTRRASTQRPRARSRE